MVKAVDVADEPRRAALIGHRRGKAERFQIRLQQQFGFNGAVKSFQRRAIERYFPHQRRIELIGRNLYRFYGTQYVGELKQKEFHFLFEQQS
jgi:hypothetical protein